ncbi:serine/threonine protein phosphatase [Devosia sp. Leaf420]|uniref:metallophosphoesterase family protein n=1 Tax=Devosia sp. Leaf420 TaxID=1736374 RepID=UPI0007123425|nr:DNA repair exonuclease [Devosia sp. Leaf420]KQT48166.1 serine/threonine protein phosphatase [Devosia sp. Leaf420]
MAFRFVHTADIHLDSPLRSLALRNPELAEVVGDASRKALIAIVDLCLSERVDALIIAGDLYDGDQTSMKTARFLATQMSRLHEAGIKVLKVRGNHDALSRISKQLVFPDSVTIFGGRASAVILRAPGNDVAFHGLSFSQTRAPESLLSKYAGPSDGMVNVGIMHTSLAGAPGHDVYAPCNVADLHGHGFDYWALGHIHSRTIHAGSRKVVMPGMPQGRDINESGQKSVSLVTVRDDRSIEIEERATSIAQFERLDVNISGAIEWHDVVHAIRSALEELRSSIFSPHLVVRLKLVGNTSLAWQIIRDQDLLLAEAEQIGERTGSVWLEKLDIDVRTLEEFVDGADPVQELAQTMRSNARSEAFREQARALIHRLVDELPPEVRDFAGKDESEANDFLERALSEGTDLVTARLRERDLQ